MGSDEQARKAGKRITRSLGWTDLAAFGILLAVIGAALSFDEAFANDALPLAFLGTVLGVAACMFGARRIGAAAALFSVVALIFLVAVSQVMLPGADSDRNLPANEPDPHRPSGMDERPTGAPGLLACHTDQHSPLRWPVSVPRPWRLR